MRNRSFLKLITAFEKTHVISSHSCSSFPSETISRRASKMQHGPPSVDLRDMRKEYCTTTTDVNGLSGGGDEFENYDDPIVKFKKWFALAERECHLYEESNSVALSTATPDGRPSCRMVLLKGFGPDGFKFFTNYESRKGKELSENPYAAMLSYWPVLDRQVRIEGKVEKLTDQEAVEYWARRPPTSQLGAYVSKQSRPLKNRKELEDRIGEVQEMYVKQSKPIPKPETWGGYLLIPDKMEFWQGREGRLHDRILFKKLSPEEQQNGEFLDGFLSKGANGWFYGRLQP